MTHACRQIELSVRTVDDCRPLEDALGILELHGIEILAHSLYADWEGLVLLIVSEDAARARRALEATGFRCESNPVVIVQAREDVGSVASLGARLYQAGVPIQYSHVADAEHGRFAVFKTDDDERALEALSADAA